ncbi:rifin [Plasmodium falciparum RAJ116]|uniref:Rifin n=1 Tax=Plasmodium falciparum RAJ116 TaxID=580058 RepID=A0A0L0D099_PLAFA|nr:rifin [Plasmodium falciparum RAJ116]
MKTTRQECKEQCEKDIQKIILKDKLEKQMAQQLTTLETKIDTDDIPTCICEKSLEDKMEKECLKCAQNLGGIVAPSTGVLGEIAALAVNAWKTTEIAAATKAAIAEGAAQGLAAGTKAGIKVVMDGLCRDFGLSAVDVNQLGLVFDTENYTNVLFISGSIKTEYSRLVCGDIISSSVPKKPFCTFVNKRIVDTSVVVGRGVSANEFIETTAQNMVSEAESVAAAKSAKVTAAKTAEFTTRNIAAVEATTTPYYTPIIVSIVAIVVIILIMVIIYLILRYRRKKKMKKKLQYIKLLEE